MQLSSERLGCFTGSEAHKLFRLPLLTDNQLNQIEIYKAKPSLTVKQQADYEELLSKVGKLKTTKTRDDYIFQKAEELTIGLEEGFFETYDTNHGQFNEYEAHDMFVKTSGLNVVYGEQKYYKINQDAGATPDATIQDFDGKIEATVDYKCPTRSFFQQKMRLIKQMLPQYQYCTKEQYYQAHWQMMATGCDKHYLVRYLAEYFEDKKTGDLVKIDLPVQTRIYWHVIHRDEKTCEDIRNEIKLASEERDKLVEIFKQPIINGKDTTPNA